LFFSIIVTVAGTLTPLSYRQAESTNNDLNQVRTSAEKGPLWEGSLSIFENNFEIDLIMFIPIAGPVFGSYAMYNTGLAISAQSIDTSVDVTIAATVATNQSVMFSSTVSGGTPPHSFQWFLNGTAVSGATLSSWTFSPTTSGVYTVFLNVKDSLGANATSNNATVTVINALTPPSLSVSPPSAANQMYFPPILILLSLFFLPDTWLEFIAYATAFGASIWLFWRIIKGAAKRELKRTGMFILICAGLLLAAAFIEEYLILTFG
jgi:hypothetical protein